MKATWNGAVLAESDNTVVVEGNHYFPMDSIDCQYFEKTDHQTVCGWKGTASYFTLNVNGAANDNAAFYYATPKEAASQVKDRVAFWRGVVVSES